MHGNQHVLQNILDFVRPQKSPLAPDHPAQARGDVAEKAFIGAGVAGLRGLHEPFECWIIRLLGHASVASPVKEAIPEQFRARSKVFVFGND
jgi:hypothetical protein